MIQALLDDLNEKAKADFGCCGTFDLADAEVRTQCGFDNLQPADAVITYNFCDDDLLPEASEGLDTWLYDHAWPLITATMLKLGFRSIEENDGSGGGLYYGGSLYRHVSQL